MIREILLWPNAFLKKKSEDVDLGSDIGTGVIIQDMLETMQHHHGAGLSAVQIGVHKRIITLDCGEGTEIWLNPRIVARSPEKEAFKEGCLSMPGIFENVQRHTWVVINAMTPVGIDQTFTAKGVRAQAFQHEIDHLNGKMYPDRMDPGARDRLRAHMRRSR